VTLFGPFLLLPLLVTATGIGYIATFGRRSLLYVIVAELLIVGPALLQLAGVLEPSYELADGVIRVLPGLAAFPPTATIVFLIVTHATIIAGTLVYVWRMRCNQLDGESRLQMQAWLLAQMGNGGQVP
jgi:hypothetical protein